MEMNGFDRCCKWGKQESEFGEGEKENVVILLKWSSNRRMTSGC